MTSQSTARTDSSRATVIEWLLDSDPSIRWQVLRDLLNAPNEVVAGERRPTLAAPLDSPGPVRLLLQFANGASLAAEGDALSTQLPPGATVAEHYHC